MNAPRAKLLVDNRASHGEGPVWMDGVLYWVDLTACRLHAWNSDQGKVRNFQFAEPVCAVAPHSDDRLLIAFAKRLASVRLQDLAIKEICPVEPDLPGTRCNDGKMDPAGRFWIGTMSQDGRTEGAGSLYRLDGGGCLTRMLDQLTIANGMDWSRNRRTMYFIDSPTREVWAFDFDPSDSSITNRRTVVAVPESFGVPDGMCVAPDDTLWVAHWGAGCVCRWDPANGRLLEKIFTGCPHTSSCCLAPDGSLFITTSRRGLTAAALDAAPQSGGLFLHPTRHQTNSEAKQ